jgi:hypothetical protein
MIKEIKKDFLSADFADFRGETLSGKGENAAVQISGPPQAKPVTS